jgi:hypothetical protein
MLPLLPQTRSSTAPQLHVCCWQSLELTFKGCARFASKLRHCCCSCQVAIAKAWCWGPPTHTCTAMQAHASLAEMQHYSRCWTKRHAP